MAYPKIALLLIISSLFAALAYADFDVTYSNINNRITIDENAQFRVTIYNDEQFTREYRIKNTNYPNWDVKTNPIVNPILIEVAPGNNKTVDLYIRPNRKYVAQGSYRLNIEVIEEATGDKKIFQPKVGVVGTDELNPEYVTTIIPSTDFPSEITPDMPLDFWIKLRNLNEKNISDAKLIVSSRLLYEEIDLDIAPKEEKIIEIKKPLDPKTDPMEDTLTVSVIYEGGNAFEPLMKKYSVKPYSSITDTTEIKKGFLTKKVTTTFTNKGNIPFDGRLNIDTAAFARLFSSTRPKAEVIKEDGELQFSWPVELAPQESYSVVVKENYLSLFILIIIIIAVALVAYVKRSPLVVKKKIIETETSEGGLAKAKILIEIKNRTGKKISKISVVDKVPKLLQLEKHTTIGSMQPSKVKKNSKHETLLLWELEELMPGEERVINYYVKTDLNILGGLTLQPSLAKFDEKGSLRSVRSNRVILKL